MLIRDANLEAEMIREREELISEEREVRDFDSVVLGGFGNLTVVQSDKETLMVEAPADIMPDIVTEVRDGTLYITMKPHTIHAGWEINYNLTVKKLDAFNLTGAGKATIYPLDTDHFHLKMSGAGKIKTHKTPVDELLISGTGMVEVLDVDLPELKVTISGAAHVRVTGKAEKQWLQLPGAGNYSGEELVSQHTEVTLSGAGRAAVTAMQTLNATLNGAGVISYAGDAQVSKRIRGIGSIHKRS
jgi:hypothetical protein